MLRRVKNLACYVGSGVELDLGIKSPGDVVIQGSVVGNIIVETPELKPRFIPVAFRKRTGIVHIQKGSYIEGDIHADVVIIDGGEVNGNVHCKQLEIGKDAWVCGTMNYETMKMDSGAEFHGTTNQRKIGLRNGKDDIKPQVAD